MRFSWLTLAHSPSPADDRRRIDELLSLARLTDELNFAGVWLTEHYFTGESIYNDSLTFAAALAATTKRIRIGFAVVQMPFHHPVRLATQLSLLDNISGGRIDLGVGKGTVYNEYEFMGFGLRSDDSRERMEEALEVFRRIWTETPLTFEGKYYKLSVPALRPAPVQQPSPPLWRSAGRPDSFRECGRLGLPILTSRMSTDVLAERWALYRQGMDEGGLDAEAQAALLQRSGVWRNVYVAESDAQAEDELAFWLADYRRHNLHARAELNPPDFQMDEAVRNAWADPDVPEEEAVRNVMATGSIYGSPETVRGQVEALRDAGVGHILCQTAYGDMPYDLAEAGLRRLGGQVMPMFANA